MHSAVGLFIYAKDCNCVPSASRKNNYNFGKILRREAVAAIVRGLMQKTRTYDLVVIGGGASGLMTAGVAASRGLRVLLLEKNKQLGKKLSISGGGRCNITNAETDVRTLLKHYGDAEQFLYSAFSQFGVDDTFAFFEKLGLPLVVEARKRAFPKTQNAPDVTRALERYIKQHNVTIMRGAKVSEILTENEQVCGVVADGMTYEARSYVLATGGISHAETGSTGDGFEWLRELGHTVQEPTPTIVPLAVREPWVHELSGTSLSFMKITFFVNGRKKFSRTGKILFTHFGVSGPLILNAAKDVADLLEEGEVSAMIDCFPDTDHGALERRILGMFDAHKNKMLRTVFDTIAPPGTHKTILSLLSDIDPEKPVHSVTTEERKAIVHLLKALPLTVTGLMGADRAVVADGGVPLTEMDMRALRSKILKNLFITGDLLHINRPSGGYSLQLCWTTGYVAGMHV